MQPLISETPTECLCKQWTCTQETPLVDGGICSENVEFKRLYQTSATDITLLSGENGRSKLLSLHSYHTFLVLCLVPTKCSNQILSCPANSCSLHQFEGFHILIWFELTQMTETPSTVDSRMCSFPSRCPDPLGTWLNASYIPPRWRIRRPNLVGTWPGRIIVQCRLPARVIICGAFPTIIGYHIIAGWCYYSGRTASIITFDSHHRCALFEFQCGWCGPVCMN